MEYDLYITIDGVDCGITPIHLDAAGNYTLCDACYPLAGYLQDGTDTNDIGHKKYTSIIERIFSMLPTEFNAAPDSGSFDNITFKILETGSY